MAGGRNAEVLARLAEEELGHYLALAEYTQREVGPSRWRVFLYRLAARAFGLTFAIKLMEAGGGEPRIPIPQWPGSCRSWKGSWPTRLSTSRSCWG